MNEKDPASEAKLETTIEPIRRSAELSPDKQFADRAPAWRVPLLLAAMLIAIAGVVAVFFYLPSQLEQEPATPELVAAPEPVVEEQEPELTAEEIEELTARAETLLAALLEQRQDLELRSAASWGEESWERYTATAVEADNAFLADDPGTAVNAYEQALAIGDELLARSDDIIVEALAAGTEALDGGNAEVATSQFELVLQLDPDNDQAQRGLARAGTLADVFAAMRRGRAFEDDGDLQNAAAAYQEAIAIDAAFASAREAYTDVSRRIADARFDALLTDGFSAIEAGRNEAAMEAFAAALAIRPNSDVAADGLTRAEEGELLNDIGIADIRAQAFERRELWGQAIERYQEALEADPSLQFAKDGLERARRREDLDAKLAALIAAPASLLTESILVDARRLLSQAQAIESPGPRHTEQTEQLAYLVDLVSTPIPVTLLSDGETTVQVYRVGNLGVFSSREIELTPGSYTVVGQRRGYRDVRETFTILPGADNGPFTIACTEPI